MNGFADKLVTMKKEKKEQKIKKKLQRNKRCKWTEKCIKKDAPDT